jgi:hypothetical protein
MSRLEYSSSVASRLTARRGLGYGQRKGIQEGHAYSVMRAVEMDGQRLLLLKNPWGKGEWTGPWSKPLMSPDNSMHTEYRANIPQAMAPRSGRPSG